MSATTPTVLVVDEDAKFLAFCERVLTHGGYDVTLAADAASARRRLAHGPVHAAVIDVTLRDSSGIHFLREMRDRGIHSPAVLMTSFPSLDTAIAGMELGALGYLVKPFGADDLARAVINAERMHSASEHARGAPTEMRARATTDSTPSGPHFDQALASLWMAFQPVVSWSRQRTVAYEAFMRVDSVVIPNAAAMLDVAVRLGRLQELGRICRGKVAAHRLQFPCKEDVYVNVHALELLDETLYSDEAPLVQFASRTILEIAGWELLEDISDLDTRAARLRKLGYRLSVDNVGADHTGLARFAFIEPDVIKFDMSLVRGIHASATRRRLIRTLTTFFKDLDIEVVAEGVENERERDSLVALGCDQLQGYLFARPAAGYPVPLW